MNEHLKALQERISFPYSRDHYTRLSEGNYQRDLLPEIPDDYWFFMEVFGPGWITSDAPFLKIADVFSNSDGFVEQELAWAAERNQESPDDFFPAFPSVPGIFPWGETDEGITMYWRVENSREDWGIAIWLRSYMEFFNCTMTEFLASAFLEGSIDLFSDYMGQPLTYTPQSKYLEFFERQEGP